MSKTGINLTILFIFTIFHCLPISAEENRPGLSLEETFNIYVRSIQNSDLKGLFTTVTSREKFIFLTSTGELIQSREGYYKFHEDWFTNKGWEMPVDVVEVSEGKDFGYVMAVFHYKSQVADGGFYYLDSYFTLIFHKEDGMWKVVADVCTPIKRYMTETNHLVKYTSEQVYLFNMIKNRRTVRKFKSTPVPKEHILKILDAACSAPTAGNQQPWKFLVIQNRSKLDHLQKEAFLWYFDEYKREKKPREEELLKVKKSLQNILANVLSAPVYIAVLVDTTAKYPDYILFDGALAAGYLMIAARSFGYGTGFFTTFFPEMKMKKFFNIPEQYKLICLTPVGIPFEWPDPPKKKDLDDFIVYESFEESNF